MTIDFAGSTAKQPIELMSGATYLVKSGSGRLVKAKYLGEVERGYKRKMKHYRFLNTDTGREITLKSRGRIKRLLVSAIAVEGDF